MNNEIKLVKKIGIKEATKLIDDSECFRIRLSGDAWNQPSLILRDDLKQIVDAYELVEKFGGIDKSKRILEKAYESCSQIILDSRKNIETTWNDLNDAINLVEQCQ